MLNHQEIEKLPRSLLLMFYTQSVRMITSRRLPHRAVSPVEHINKSHYPPSFHTNSITVDMATKTAIYSISLIEKYHSGTWPQAQLSPSSSTSQYYSGHGRKSCYLSNLPQSSITSGTWPQEQLSPQFPHKQYHSGHGHKKCYLSNFTHRAVSPVDIAKGAGFYPIYFTEHYHQWTWPQELPYVQSPSYSSIYQ